MRFKLGDKVVPIDKSVGGNLDDSTVWRLAQRNNQSYLTVKEIEPCAFADYGLAYTHSFGSLSGVDFYNECDLKPYKNKEVVNR